MIQKQDYIIKFKEDIIIVKLDIGLLVILKENGKRYLKI